MDRGVYRNKITQGPLVTFPVVVKETDLLVHAKKKMTLETTELVLRYRGYVEAFILEHPSFARSLVPWFSNGPSPDIVREMIRAGEKAGVGPMAAVAGAMAQFVGQGLLTLVDEVIVENGGDVFIKTNQPVTVGIYSGTSPLSLKVGIKVDAARKAKAVCTSSGTIGHSLSFGKADAVVVISDVCALADAAATAVCNRVKNHKDMQRAMAFGQRIPGVDGMVIICEDKMAMWGAIELVRLS